MIKWIRRHKFAALFLALAGALIILISISYVKGTGFFGQGVNRAEAAVSAPLSSFVNNVKSNVRGLLHFKSTMRENEALEEENAALKREITRIRLSEKELTELRELANALHYESVAESYEYVSGEVVAMDQSDYFTSFTINVGTEKGVTQDDVVIAGNGLVGRVLETGTGYSKIISVIDDTVSVSFEVQRDMNILGVATGDGKGGIAGYTFDGSAGIVEGDVLLTTGIGMYPEGIEIGRTAEVNYNSDTQLMTIQAEPAVNFQNLRKVMVLLR